MEPKIAKHLVFFGLFIVAVVFGVVLLWPFLRVLVASVALAVIFYPIHQWFLRRVTRGNKWFSALFTVITFLIIVCGPLLLIGSAVFHQTQSIYVSVTQDGGAGGFLDRISASVNSYFPFAALNLEEHAASIISGITSRIGDIAGVFFATIFGLLLIILTMFYFLKDGPRWRRAIIHGSPLSDENTEKVIVKLSHAIDGVVKGYLFIALIQGFLMGMGLWLFGVPNPALWGVLAGIASLIPVVGTALISVPAVIFLFSIGNTGAAIGLAIWSGVLVGLIDNIVSPIIVGRKIDIHPMFILFAVLGGIALMGPVGILIGPLVVSFIYALTSVYSSEMKS